MPNLAQNEEITPQTQALKAGLPPTPFRGFASPRSNTTYTPNQFFDVCLPHSSRGVVRLVAYMIRKTLGWCDAEGNPQEECIAVSWQELVTHAGISRDMLRQALDEAIAGSFVRCVREGRSNEARQAGQTAIYELCWDNSPEYIKDPKKFRGFFEGEGNRTDIPNEFFDRLIPRESLTIIKAVGSIIRFSIGFQARRGVRRQHVRLSYSDIQRYAHVRSRSALSGALATAMRRNYVARLEPGVFDPNAGRASRAAVYALKWADGFGSIIGQKSGPAQNHAVSDDRSEIWTGERSEKRTGIGQKSGPEDRSEKWTGIETKQRNETLKQQAAAAYEQNEAWALLREKGFDEKTARTMAERFSAGQIQRQIDWLPSRAPRRNPLGMLRLAIEEDWADPAVEGAEAQSAGGVFASHFYAAIAGNPSEPIAEPSTKDIVAAHRFLRRVAVDENAEPDPAYWGRAFGSLIAEDLPALARAGMTVTWAFRLRGDGFYLRHTASLKAKRLRAEHAARETHEAAHQASWLCYLKAEESRVKKERPDDYARFEEHRAEERRRIIESAYAVFTEERIARFDGEKRRILDFQEFFPAEIPDFWAWDDRLNPTPFTPARLSAPTPIKP